MSEQFELNFNKEESVDQSAEFRKAEKMLFEGVLDRIKRGDQRGRMEYQEFLELYKSDKEGMSYLAEVYNNWAEVNKPDKIYEVDEYKDRFEHTKYTLVEKQKPAA